MKKISILLATIIVAFFAGLQSCSKAGEGTVGPAGPAGATGPAGPAGPAGGNGAPGAAGTANVIYGGWVKMDLPGYWYKGTAANSTTNSWGGNFAAPISQDILDKGAVMVYARYAGNTSKVFLLPTSVNITGNAALVTTEIFIQLNRVYIENLWTFFPAPATYIPSLYLSEFRYIIIPGAVNGRKANIDYADYNAVKAAYNLPD